MLHDAPEAVADPGAAVAPDGEELLGPLPEAALWGLVSAFTLFVALGLAVRLPHAPLQSGLAAAVALLCGFALLRVPPRRSVLVMVVATAAVAFLGHATASNVGWFSVCVLGCWCAVASPRSHTIAYLCGALALFAGEALWAQRDPGWAAWATGTVFSVGASLLIRHNLDLVAQLRAAQAGLAAKARAEERNRIARELHDVIGHSLTVVALHVASARMAVTYEPADSERSLLEAERLVRETLDEVRATVGILRVDDSHEGSPTAPAPRITDIASLVEQFGDAGGNISYRLEGDLRRVPATIELAAYRIAQEALTNTAKHAPGGGATLSLVVGDDALSLTVSNEMASRGSRRSGAAGLGLLSMQERAEAVGGRFASGPAGATWYVQAVLPIRAPREMRAAQ